MGCGGGREGQREEGKEGELWLVCKKKADLCLAWKKRQHEIKKRDGQGRGRALGGMGNGE